MNKISQTLQERDKTHGSYSNVASVAQRIKDIIRGNDSNLGQVHKESLDLIATKIARILCGNPNDADHWLDIAGYATLVHNIISKE